MQYDVPGTWLRERFVLAVLLAPLDLLAALLAEPVDGHGHDALRLLGLGVVHERERVLMLGRALLHVAALRAHGHFGCWSLGHCNDVKSTVPIQRALFMMWTT